MLMRTRPLALVAALALAATACADDPAEPGPTSPPTTTPAATTAAPTTVPEATTTTALPPGLPQEIPLRQGVTYRIARAVIRRGMRFTSPVDGATGLSGRGAFGIFADEGEP